MFIFDGELQKIENAQISIKDRGLQLGDGLFETMQMRNKKIIKLDLHWFRLVNSALKTDLNLPINFRQLEKDIEKLVKVHDIVNAGFRLTITPGYGKRGLLTKITTPGHYFLEFFDLPKQSLTPYRLCFSTIRAEPTNPLSSIKSLSYMAHVFVKKEALAKGFDDAIQLTPEGKISEISCANIFIIKQGIVYTPPLSDGLLPGITRQRVIEHCLLNEIYCLEQSLDQRELLSADAIFVTNTLLGVLKVDFVNNKKYSSSNLLESIKLFIDQ